MLNFITLREVKKLGEQVALMKDRPTGKLTSSYCPPITKPLDDIDSYEQFVKDLQRDEFQKSIVSFSFLN